MEKFRNKYRVASARAQWWDYGWNGAYFITICTQEREHYFGKIADAQMIPSESGRIAETIWNEIPKQFKYAELGDFVVMPNHIHGILILNKTGTASETNPNHTGGVTGEKNPMLHENVSRIVRWYKGRCTFEIRKINAGFGWQSRFHDHIIRNDAEYQRISDYIINNPSKWGDDKFHSQ